MSMTTEIEVQVSGAKITGAEVRSDGTCKLTVEIVAPEDKEEATTETTAETTAEVAAEISKVNPDVLLLVEASKLSVNDKFMQYEPKEGTKEAIFKRTLTRAIQSGTLKDFWRPKMDPSFDETGDCICYVAGKRPAVGKSKNWWKEAAKKVRLQEGTPKQYITFLGFLIKKLVETGWDVADAWHAVCSDSKSLGHYCNSDNAKHKLEVTGSREVCGFYDLANTFKILEKDEGEAGYHCCWFGGGSYRYNNSEFCPLANLQEQFYPEDPCFDSVGWLVRNCSTD